jgi:hypothetical protein
MLRSALIIMFLCTPAYAQNSINLALPSSPQNYQSDKIRSGDLDCSNAIGSASTLEFGVTGIINESDFGNDPIKDVGVFGRITIPIGRVAKERINCNTLYELEIERKRLELMKLEQEIEMFRELQFENQ